MTIQYKFFSIPVNNEEDMEAELNSFLRANRIISIKKELLKLDNGAYWGLAIEYNTGKGKSFAGNINQKPKIDYREVLSEGDFAIYARLREWRKETANKENVQIYTVFTNEQLAAIVQKKIVSKSKMKEIAGIGDARINNYGDQIIKIMKEELEKSGEKKEGPIPGDIKV